jgi:hypothetical protein
LEALASGKFILEFALKLGALVYFALFFCCTNVTFTSESHVKSTQLPKFPTNDVQNFKIKSTRSHPSYSTLVTLLQPSQDKKSSKIPTDSDSFTSLFISWQKNKAPPIYPNAQTGRIVTTTEFSLFYVAVILLVLAAH